MSKGKIIFLNGTSSSGKSTLAAKIQEISEEKYYHVKIDTFCTMVHGKFFNLDYVNTENSAASAMHNFVLSLSNKGENVIVDSVILDQKESWLKECVELLHDMPVTFVKVYCPLPELERRELERGDRKVGLAKYQVGNMNFNDIYDLEVNTYEHTPEECARIVIDGVELQGEDSAFRRIYEGYGL